MKIGILTFHRAINYGAFLQSFALKKYLENNGFEVSIIDYWPKEHAKTYNIFTWYNDKSFRFNIFNLLKSAINFRLSVIRYLKFINNQKNGLGLSGKVIFNNKYELIHLDYDCIIYGSDQIWWNSVIDNYTGFDPVYWGEFVDKSIRKISYAPSMGIINLNEEQLDQIKQYMINFNSISVREIELKLIISNLTQSKVQVVLDPVFLLDKDIWSSFCKPISKKKYILYYNLMYSIEANILVEELKKKFDCDVIEITGRVDMFKYSKKYKQTASPFEYLTLFKNAEFVISTSFHGVAFSIIFEKQFFALGMKNNSGRVESLLCQLDLIDRLLINTNNFPLTKIDYSQVNPKLSKLIGDSKHYLNSSLLDEK